MADHVKNLHEHHQSQIQKGSHMFVFHLSRALLADDTMWIGDHTFPVPLTFFLALFFHSCSFES